MGLFGIFSQKETVENIKKYIKNGAVVLDVRTAAEWEEGHSDGAKHIVLNAIPDHIEEVKSWNRPVNQERRKKLEFLKQPDGLITEPLLSSIFYELCKSVDCKY